ncbi:unnamed protein product [Closterium sp. NIES-54]
MTTIRVLLHVAALRDYELQSLDFSTAFLQGSLHEEIWLRRPPGSLGRFLLVLQRFGFTYYSPQSTPLPTGHSLSAPPSDEFVEPSGLYPELVGCLMYLMTCTRPDLAYQPLGAVSTMAGPDERGGRVAGGSGEAQAQGQPRDSAMAPMQPSLGPPRDEPRVFGLDKFNGDNFDNFKMENIFDHYDLLEVMEGTEKRPENDPEKSPWVRKSAQGYLLLGQALGSSQIRHIKPFQREPEKGPKAWAALKGVHAPATAAVAVVLERQMAALRIEEDEAVEEGVQKFFDLLTRLEGADLNYSDLQKKTKLLALLPDSWSSLIINLNRDLPHLSLEDVKRAILQEDFRRRTSKLGEHEESGGSAKEQHKGEENPKAVAEEEYGENMWGTIASAAFSNPTLATGECDWLTLHRRMGHVALPILQQLVKDEMVAGIRVKGEPDEVLGCSTCMQAKFTRYPFSSSEATAKAPLDEVVMDVVGPLKHGAARAEYFLTIVDVYTRMTWVYVLSKKSDVAQTVKTDWLPMVER